MFAMKLSLYFYRIFAAVFASCKLYLVAQEVDSNKKLALRYSHRLFTVPYFSVRS